MIFVDPRAGSSELLKPLLAMDLPVEELQLDFGDVHFVGRGEQGVPLTIGIEHKKLPDLITSMQTGRLAGHQLPGMLQTYDRSWLIVEGEWDQDSQGKVTMWKGRKRKALTGISSAVELEKRILTLETRGGFRVRICPKRQDTLRFIYALYRYWSDTDLDQHKSHLAVHSPDIDSGMRLPMSDFRKALQVLLPGVGYAASRNIEERFEGSWRRMMLATENDWAGIDIVSDKGTRKKLGSVRARKIMEALQ